MTIDISRRNFIKLGTVFGISVMIGRLPDAFAVEINSGPGPTDWMSPDGKVRYRWDAVRKVAGQKDFARDFRARDLPGWPREQAHAFFIKATRADRTFEGVDLSILGSELQPERLVLHENLAGDGVTMPQAEGLAADFYGKNFLVPARTRRPTTARHAMSASGATVRQPHPCIRRCRTPSFGALSTAITRSGRRKARPDFSCPPR